MDDKNFARKANEIFDRSVEIYHVTDNIDTPAASPYPENSTEDLLFRKNWVDAAQWHMEDIIRDPGIDPAAGMALKHRIDASNQLRTDMVEQLDDAFRKHYSSVKPLPDATVNTESPAWAIDRLSILALKIWHMREQAQRADTSADFRSRALAKLDILLQQREDLTAAIDTLLDDIAAGRKYMKVYKQMKLYNDPETNPVLYGKK